MCGSSYLNLKQGEGSSQMQGEGSGKGKQIASSALPKMNLTKETGAKKLMANAFKGNLKIDLLPDDDDVNDRVMGLYGDDLSEDDMLSEEMLEVQP